MRTERSIMYKTPCRNDSVDQSLIDGTFKLRNLTTIRQHLFSRDSISLQDDICLTEESMNLTGNVRIDTAFSFSFLSTINYQQDTIFRYFREICKFLYNFECNWIEISQHR